MAAGRRRDRGGGRRGARLSGASPDRSRSRGGAYAGAIARIAFLVAALLAGFLAFWVFDLLSEEDVRDLIEPLGAWAAPAYVVVAGVLGSALVPGPLLAGVSGLLFGPALGTVVTIAAATLSAIIGLTIGRGAAQETFHDKRLARFAERHGLLAVIVARLAPGLPDAPASYAFGATRIALWQIVLGTIIGAAPRAFSYTSIGASLDDPGSPLALAGFAGVILTGIAGALVARRLYAARDRSHS